MQIEGTRDLRVARDAAWRGAFDADTLKACIDGCRTWAERVPGEYDVVVVASLGPFKATFTGTARILERIDGTLLRIEGQGGGGLAGSGRMVLTVRLADAPAGTAVRWLADVEAGGRIARIGAPLVERAVRSFADRFLDRFDAVVAGRTDHDEAPR